MELFLVFLVTRLTDVKDGLSDVAVTSGLLLLACVVVRVANEFNVSAEDKKEALRYGANPVEWLGSSNDAWLYAAAKRSTGRGLWWFTPIFVLSLGINLLLPTTRDAVVIAGGYGLVEAVKNERVQRLFGKSAQVATQWLDAQLNESIAKPAAVPASVASDAQSPQK